MKTFRVICLLQFVVTCTGFSAMNLTGWTEVDRYSRWSSSNPGPESIRLDEAASSSTVAPGWVISDFIVDPNSTVTITMEILGSGDDDFAGIIFGYRDADHFYLVDWKRGAQSYNWGDAVAVNDDYAERGIKIKKIDGSWTRDGLWGGTDGLGVTTLAGPVGGAWNFNTPYTFTIELNYGHIVISMNDEPLFDIFDETFTGGRIGGYGFSQDDLLFYDVTVTPDPYACFVNFEDFALFAQEWLLAMPFLHADFDDNGQVDITDLNYLALYWLDTCPAGWPLK